MSLQERATKEVANYFNNIRLYYGPEVKELCKNFFIKGATSIA